MANDSKNFLNSDKDVFYIYFSEWGPQVVVNVKEFFSNVALFIFVTKLDKHRSFQVFSASSRNVIAYGFSFLLRKLNLFQKSNNISRINSANIESIKLSSFGFGTAKDTCNQFDNIVLNFLGLESLVNGTDCSFAVIAICHGSGDEK